MAVDGAGGFGEVAEDVDEEKTGYPSHVASSQRENWHCKSHYKRNFAIYHRFEVLKCCSLGLGARR